MKKQKINVVVNIPDKEYVSELMADAMASLIIKRISKYDVEVQVAIIKELVSEI